MTTTFIDSQVIKPEVKDVVKVLNHWFYIIEVREKEVMIRRNGIYGSPVLINADMLHIIIYRPDPIAKKSFYWLLKLMLSEELKD
jgi:hypothetical protein